MQLAVKLMLVATFGLALPTAVQARELEVSRATVVQKCGGDLASNGNVIGCTVACPSGVNGKTCDYSCGGPEGDGCRIQVFSRLGDVSRNRNLHAQQIKTR